MYEPFKKWLGLNTREASTDILPVEFTILQNFNPFIEPGKLVPEKGYAKKFADSVNSSMILEAAKREDNGDCFIIANSGQYLHRWVNGVKETGSYGFGDLVAISVPRTTISHKGVIRISGDDGLSHSWGVYRSGLYEPRWVGYIDRYRFGYGSAFLIQEYANLTQGVHPPIYVGSGNPESYTIKVEYTRGGTGAAVDTTFFYECSFIYDGFQESNPVYCGTSSNLNGYEYVDIKITADPNMNKRITAINLYRGTSQAGPYYYFKTVYIEYIPVTQTDVWTATGNYYYNTSRDYQVTELTELMENRFPFILTTKISPYYKYDIIHKDIRYVANVRTGTYASMNPRKLNMWLYSPPFQYDVLPDTNYGTLPNSITGIAKTDNYVVMFTKNNMFFVLENQIISVKKWIGCWSHDSIAYYDNNIFWVNREGIQWWDGFRNRNILSAKLQTFWNSLSDSAVQSALGKFDPNQREYLLIIPGTRALVYNLEFDAWREVTGFSSFTIIKNDNDGKIIASICSGGGDYIYDLRYGSDFNGSAMTCTAKTKKFSLDKKMYFALLRLFSMYICKSGTYSIKIYKDTDTLVRTVIFDNQSYELMIDKPVVGDSSNDSVFQRNMSLEFVLSSPVDGDEINEIGFEYNLHDLL